MNKYFVEDLILRVFHFQIAHQLLAGLLGTRTHVLMSSKVLRRDKQRAS